MMVHDKKNYLVVLNELHSVFFRKLIAVVSGIIALSVFFLFTDSDKHSINPDMIVSANNTGGTSIITGLITYNTKVAVVIIRGIDSWVTITGSTVAHIRQFSNGLQSDHQRLDPGVTKYAAYGIAGAAFIFALAMVVVSRIRHQF